MSVKTLLSFIEFFTELLYKAQDRHNQRASDLQERANVLLAEREQNLIEAAVAKRVADKIADRIS
jgi:hypothetical protein